MTAPFAARIVALDTVLGRSLGDMPRGGSIGIRLSRKITSRLTAEFDIDYALSEAETPYGIIGVKVWIFKGEILEHDPQARDRRAAEAQDGAAPRGPRRERA